jgi:ribosomal protein S12 methylthiotransferase
MNEGKILPYLDIPFQHGSPAVLKNMRRPANQEKTAARIQKWRQECPELTLRSTFIVGFPGETEEDFEFLLQWLSEAQIDRLGCFKYEDVKGAPSHHLENHVPEEVKQERLERLMAHQQAISEQRLAAKVGKRMKVLVDSVEDGQAIARGPGDAPEIDGNVIFKATKRLLPGSFAEVEITDSDAYDLYGVAV